MLNFKNMILGAVASAMIAVSASAAPVLVRDGNGGNLFNGGAGFRDLTIRLNGSNQNVRAGQFALQLSLDNGENWVDFLAYCLEADELIGINGSTPVSGNLIKLVDSTIYTGDNRTGIARVWQNLGNSVDTADEAAAAQIAFWEVATDGNAGGGPDRGLFDDSFRFFGGGTVYNLARDYLHGGNASQLNNIWVIERDGFQDLVLIGFTPPTETPVMEPGTLGLLGMGLAGLIAVRRRKHSA